jgi:transposase
MDPRQQRGIVIAAMAKLIKVNGLWVVPSQTKRMTNYFVNLEQGTCTCKDFEETQQDCKHMHAARIVTQREASQQAGLQGTEVMQIDTKKKTYPQNWRTYNKAQTEEKERFRVLLHDLCRNLKHAKVKPGRPRTPLSDVVFAAAYKVYSTVSTRRFCTDLKDAEKNGYVSKAIHYNSVCAYLEWPDLTPVLKRLIGVSALPLRDVESDFAVDSTGFATSRFVRWFDERFNVERSGHDWVKVHVMSGVKTNVVTAIEIRGRSAGDAPLFGPLVRTTRKNFNIKAISADKAYLSEDNIEIAFEAGAEPFIPFKVDSTEHGDGLWDKMFHYYQTRRDEFLQHYHKRSNVEATFNMIKAKFRDHVRSRSDTAMKNEVLCKVLCHNICCVIHSHCDLGIEPVFWPGEKPQQAG